MDKAFFVQNIKDVCKTKGIKPTVACRESGVGTSFINNIEARGQVPSVEKVQRLASYLGVTTSELLGEKREFASFTEVRLNARQQQLINLFDAASPDLQSAAFAVLESAEMKVKGVDDGWATVQIKGSSVVPGKVLGAEPVAVEAVVPVAGKVKKLPCGRVTVRPKKRATSRGKGRGGPARGR